MPQLRGNYHFIPKQKLTRSLLLGIEITSFFPFFVHCLYRFLFVITPQSSLVALPPTIRRPWSLARDLSYTCIGQRHKITNCE